MKRTAAVIFSLLSMGVVTGCVADDDGYEGREGRWWSKYSLDVAPVNSELYKNECGACHFAYQPGLLPAASWERMMTGLDDHFGDNAELDQTTTDTIRRYLLDNAADRSDYKRSRKIVQAQPQGAAPLRITETRYFVRKHDELPARLVVDNPKVSSYSRCEACHQGAERGSYDDDGVRIPGFGRWDD